MEVYSTSIYLDSVNEAPTDDALVVLVAGSPMTALRSPEDALVGRARGTTTALVC